VTPPAARVLYRAIVESLERLGYQRLKTTWSFRDVPEGAADRLFQVLPGDVEEQSRSARGICVSTTRRLHVAVLFGVLQHPNIIEERVLPEEERITDALLDLRDVDGVRVTYADTDELGGRIVAVFVVTSSYERPA
jgi:hypothetical protein